MPILSCMCRIPSSALMFPELYRQLKGVEDVGIGREFEADQWISGGSVSRRLCFDLSPPSSFDGTEPRSSDYHMRSRLNKQCKSPHT
jgi:hypothetical protein